MTAPPTSAREVVSKAVRSAWARPVPITVSQWAERHRVLLDRGAAEPGRWSNARAPYLTAMMDDYSDPAVRRSYWMKAEQVGGTEALINILGYIIDQKPGPVLMVYPNQDMAAKVCRDRLLPAFRKIPAIARHFTDRKQDAQSLEIRFDAMTLRLAGANSEANIESFPYRDVIVDELDRCPPETISMIEGRTRTFRDSKIIAIGRPDEEGRGIHKAYGDGNQCEYMVPCPGCGEYSARTFSQVKWHGGTDADPKDVYQTAWFRCPRHECDYSARSHENAWQLARGVWCPKGMTVRRGGELTGTPERSKEVTSRWVRGLLHAFEPNPYGLVASEFVRNKGNQTREWAGRRLGEPFISKGRRIEAHELRKLCIEIEDGGYRRGVVRKDAAFITAQADVQKDCIYLEFVAWSLEGEDWLVDHVRLARTENDGLVNLWPQLLRTFARIGDGGESLGEMPVAVAGVDSGHFTVEVYDAVRPRMAGRWGGAKSGDAMVGPPVFPTKGQPGQNDTRVSFWGRPEKDERNRPIKGGVWLLNLNTHILKTETYDDLRAAMAAQRASENRKAGRPVAAGDSVAVARCHFPEDTDSDYFIQIAAETLKEKFVAGRLVYRWVRLRQDMPNHYLDCRVIGKALAKWMLQKLGKSVQPSTVGSDQKVPPQRTPLRGISERLRDRGGGGGGGFRDAVRRRRGMGGVGDEPE